MKTKRNMKHCHCFILLAGLILASLPAAAPAASGIWTVDMETDASKLVMSLEKMAGIAAPQGWPGAFGKLFIFRSDWNADGSRFVTYLKSTKGKFGSKAYTMKADGTDVRFFYDEPRHYGWRDATTLVEGKDWCTVTDDGSGKKHNPPGGGKALAASEAQPIK